LRETLEESGARVELGAPFTMISVPRVNQVHLYYRARVRELGFKPGEETLEVALYEEARIPWEEIAFRTVGATLRHWFADRLQGVFAFHNEDLTEALHRRGSECRGPGTRCRRTAAALFAHPSHRRQRYAAPRQPDPG
jgi:hypothetical protein